MSQLLNNLLRKAIQSGQANINGRMSYDNGYKGPLESKYSATINNEILTFTHWGTKTLELDLKGRTIIDYYGESVSDRDSLNDVLNYFNLSNLGGFHFYPSKDLFTLEDN